MHGKRHAGDHATNCVAFSRFGSRFLPPLIGLCNQATLSMTRLQDESPVLNTAHHMPTPSLPTYLTKRELNELLTSSTLQCNNANFSTSELRSWTVPVYPVLTSVPRWALRTRHPNALTCWGPSSPAASLKFFAMLFQASQHYSTFDAFLPLTFSP